MPPAAGEPLTLFTAPIADLAMKLANQQWAGAGTVISVARGSALAVFRHRPWPAAAMSRW